MMFPYILRGSFHEQQLDSTKLEMDHDEDAFYKIFDLAPFISSFQISPPQHVLVVTPISGGVTSKSFKVNKLECF